MTVKDLVNQYPGEFDIVVDERGNSSNIYGEAQRLSDDFTEELAAIRGDERLSEVGKKDAISTLVRKSQAALDEWRTATQGIFDSLLEYHNGGIRDAVATLRDDSENQSLRREIRDAAKGMDANQREQLYRQGDATVRHALEETKAISISKDGAVLYRPYVKQELIQETLLQAGREAVPETAYAIDNARASEERFHILAGTLGNDIAAAAPDAVEPEITIVQPAEAR